MANSARNIFALINKSLRTEIRQNFSLSGVFLFLVTSTFVCYKVFNTINGLAWISLFWIILLFVSINLVVRSFDLQLMRRKWLYTTLYEPMVLFSSKLIVNALFMIIAAIALFLMMTLFFNNFIKDYFLFGTGLFLGILGLTSIMTLLAAISLHADSNPVLLSVLAMPLCLPVLLLCVKIHAVSFALIQDSAVSSDIWLLVGINCLSLGLAYILFPNIWKA